MQSIVFLHINKTAGVSINDALLKSPYCSHNTARWWWENHPEVWDKAFRFAFVRNPWDKEVSDYMFHRSRPQSDSSKQNWSFRRHLEYYFRRPDDWKWYLPPDSFPPDSCVHWCWHRHQLDWISLEPGKPAVDFIGRFEHLKEDFKELCRRLGIPPRKLKHYHRTGYTGKRKKNPLGYVEWYDDETRQWVAEHYARDLEYFGFEFGKEVG